MKDILFILALPILIPYLLIIDWYNRKYVGEQMDDEDLE